jgi:hypothetical protein
LKFGTCLQLKFCIERIERVLQASSQKRTIHFIAFLSISIQQNPSILKQAVQWTPEVTVLPDTVHSVELEMRLSVKCGESVDVDLYVDVIPPSWEGSDSSSDCLNRLELSQRHLTCGRLLCPCRQLGALMR